MSSRNKHSVLWSLVVVNAVLLTVLVMRHANAPAQAQAQMINRPSDYMMIPANLPGQPNGVVYMLDTNNGLLSAVSYDSTNNKVVTMPKLDVNQILNPAPAGPAPRR